MNISELVTSRYSCRKFSSRPVDDEKLHKILDAAISAPTAKNIRPVKIWVMKSPESLEKITSCAPFPWMKDVPIILAVGGLGDGAFVRPSDGRNFEDVDASIIATHIMLAVHAEGLGTTWVGYFDAPKAAELFPEMKGYDLVALFPVGYPADDAMPSDRHFSHKSKADIVSVL